MRWRILIWLLLGSTLGGAVWCWCHERASLTHSRPWRLEAKHVVTAQLFSHPTVSVSSDSAQPPGQQGLRLSNTTNMLEALVRNPRAILLENATIDTTSPLSLLIPPILKSDADPGAYIVQFRSDLSRSLRGVLERSGATIISYVPNNAYLVRANARTAALLMAEPGISSVIPFEPYYKLKSPLLAKALRPEADMSLTIRLLLSEDPLVIDQLMAAGAVVLAQGQSPFGKLARVLCPETLLPRIARLPGVLEMESAGHPVTANDLTRARVGVTAGPVAPANYLGLSGSNVLVNVNDSGVDVTHPDLQGRVLTDKALSGIDTDGHGTHVAAIIAGSGFESQSVTNAPGSPLPPVPKQFRGLAPNAGIFSIALDSDSPGNIDEFYLQQTAATNGAVISNNSWHYAGDTAYDLGAACFDAAVRDSISTTPGSQPVLYVFAAGNAGNGSPDGSGGMPGTVQSPATAKNVITVGAIEQPRFVTNRTWVCSTNGGVVTCQTNQPWLSSTDSSNQVASFSSRGNVGIGIEGTSGRFKPDVVAPGTFVVSARSSSWDEADYLSRPNPNLPLNPNDNSIQVFGELNEGLGPFYRFESGTSLAAAAVSGTLALMEEFFHTRLGRTNSPALMKALLINGARSVSGAYNLHTPGSTNSEGWGVVQLPNSLPGVLTNMAAAASSMWIFDQDPLNALTTSESQTRFVTVNPAGQGLPLRVTLAWTDPPANPVAGLKLVNDLDLVVTNLQTGEVFWGNDIPPGTTFNVAWQPDHAPNLDAVNNVENVYLPPTLSSNYSVTVLARRVAVNAVTKSPDVLAQDYALVVSCGDGQVPDALSITTSGPLAMDIAGPIVLTNSFPLGGPDFGTYLANQRVSAISPSAGTNVIPSPLFTNGMLTIGTPEQWRFYVFTNDSSFSNLVFLTFLSKSVGAFPGQALYNSAIASGLPWSAAADLDLYVSLDPALTNLDPVALAAADSSVSRGGTEAIIYSNAAPAVYYIGVKCESLQGAEFGVLVDAALEPFAQPDSLGNEVLRGFPIPSSSGSGDAGTTPQQYSFFITPDSFPVRRVLATNTLTFVSPSDFQLTLNHNDSAAVLHNYSTNGPLAGTQTFVYDDAQENDLSGVSPSDGPGTLRLFNGGDASGLWLMTLQATNQTEIIQNASLFLERQQDLAGNIGVDLLPAACRADFIRVGPQATNLTTTVALNSGTGPVSLQVFAIDSPAGNCPSLVVSNVGSLTIDEFSQPPLNPGIYVVRTCNLGPDPVNLNIQSLFVLGTSDAAPAVYSSATPVRISDDALSVSRLMVTNTDPILSLEVGVRIRHPRISDLALSLVGPDGTRVLLAGGRGATSADGMGADLTVTNTTPVTFSGGPQAVTNVFETGKTSGSILVVYDFFSLPDDMRVYYENSLLYDSGSVSFSNSTSFGYGPGTDTFFTVVMNQGGNNEPSTSWFYSVTATRIEPLYFTFTENTNLTPVPVKFAPVPFTNYTIAPGPETAGGVFYLPEESLGKFAGKNPLGEWRLEILDTRKGATNPPPMLDSWQLSLSLASSTATPLPLAGAQPVTNLVAPGQIQWYEVDVPDWVSFSTNSLIAASAPVTVLFNAAVPPTGTNATDLLLGSNVLNAAWVLRTNAVPGFAGGGRYFLGLQNTNPTTVSAAFAVNFDVAQVTTLSSGVAFFSTNSGPFNHVDYYRYVVGSNAVRTQFEVNSPTSDVTLLARKGAPLPNFANYNFISANTGTNDELIVVSESTTPVSLTPGEWFLGVVDAAGTPAAYTILATDFSDYDTNLLVSEPLVSGDSLCLSWNSMPGVHYFVQGKAALSDENWTTLSTTLTASDFTTPFCIPFPTSFAYFRVLEGLALVPQFPAVSSLVLTNNGVLLQWSASTNSVFKIQWSAALNPANWQPVSTPVTSANGTFLFFDDGTQTGGSAGQRFYRLQQLQ